MWCRSPILGVRRKRTASVTCLDEWLFVFVHKTCHQDLQTPVSYILVYGVTWKLWCICSIITSCVLSNTVNRLYQGILNCQNTTWFYGTPEVNVISFTPMRKVWTSLSRFWRNTYRQHYCWLPCGVLPKSEANLERKNKHWFKLRSKVCLFLNRFSRISQPFSKFLWSSLVKHVIHIGK